jgi:hypothetical protein
MRSTRRPYCRASRSKPHLKPLTTIAHGGLFNRTVTIRSTRRARHLALSRGRHGGYSQYPTQDKCGIAFPLHSKPSIASEMLSRTPPLARSRRDPSRLPRLVLHLLGCSFPSRFRSRGHESFSSPLLVRKCSTSGGIELCLKVLG